MSEIVEELAPTGDDERSGDKEYNPAMEPDKAAAWLNMLRESEKAYEEWNDACDNIEKLYANLAAAALGARATGSSICSGPTSRS